MKNKKMILICIIIFILLVGILCFVLFNKNNTKTTETPELTDKTDTEPVNLLEAVLKKNGKTKQEANYYTFAGGEVLNEDSYFINYAFISNNKAYIYDPEKLKIDEVSYKKVYDIPENIKVTNIGIPYGSDIYFYDDTGKKYVIYDDNVDNKVKEGYEMFENSIYKFKDTNTDLYSVAHNLTRNYDMRCNLFYVKDNIIYKIVEEYYHFTEKRTVPATTYKVNGNYEEEKILHIYNDRIVKTDKGFYELIDYSENGNVYTTTMKIDLLTKFYDDVLTFTYDYVVLKDYTLIPINDVMTNRSKKYLNDFYLDRLDQKPVEFVE